VEDPAATALLHDPHRGLGGILDGHWQAAALGDLCEVLARQLRVEMAGRHRHVLRVPARAFGAD